MGIMRKVLTGVGCAASVATGVVTGKIVGAKVYEYTGNTAVAVLAGGGAGATVGLAGVGTTMAVCQLSIDSEHWKDSCDLEERLAKKKEEDENKEFLDEIANLNDLVGKYYANEIKLRHEIDRLEEENQKLKERETKRHERLRASLQRSAEEDDQDEGNCFDVFKEEDKK